MTKPSTVIHAAGGLIVFVILGYYLYTNMAARQAVSQAVRDDVVRVATVVAAKRDLQSSWQVAATFEPAWSVDLVSRSDGRVAQLSSKEGDRVRRGQVLATLDYEDLPAQIRQAEGTVISAQAALEQATADWQRLAGLLDKDAVSAQMVDTARFKRDSSRGQLQSAQASLDGLAVKAAQSQVIAPQDGVVLKRYLAAGQFVKSGTPVLLIGDISSLIARVTPLASENLASGIPVGVPLDVALPGDSQWRFTGLVTGVLPSDGQLAVIPELEMQVDNSAGWLRPGKYARLTVRSRSVQSALCLPVKAVRVTTGETVAYVVDADGFLRKRVVVTGAGNQEWIEVTAGVAVGETVAAAVQEYFKDGMKVQVIPSS